MARARMARVALITSLLVGCGGSTLIGEGAGGAASGASGESGAAGSGGRAGSGVGGGSSGRTATGGTGGTSAGSGGSATAGSGNTGNTGNAGGSGGGYEPCAGKPCGASCSQCDPSDSTCAELAVANYCDVSGNCSPSFPTCELPECEVPSDCPPTGFPCQQCVGGVQACPIAQCVGGKCQTAFPTCESECESDADCPVSLAPCQLCPDGSTACPWSHCVNGACESGTETCAGEDTCAGKACGDPCSLCKADACPVIPVSTYCDENLECQITVPACANRCESNDECNMTDDCPQCPGVSGCAPRSCVNGACVLECPEPTDPCGGCEQSEMCVYQVGGPGPSTGFSCAAVSDCDAPGPCACIVGQGMCQYVEATAEQGAYCSCDNGLE